MTRLKIEFNDDVSRKLERLYKESPQSLDRALKHAATSVKGYILASQIKEFGSKFKVKDDGNEKRGTKFTKTGKTRYRVEVHPRFQVLEKGAYITPVNGKALRFYDRLGTEVIAKAVMIPKRPTFKPGLRDAIRADAINKAMAQSIDLEMKRLKLR